MLAEVISIGDELASGQRLDTNSRWLSQQLGDLGVRVVRHTTVADDLEINVEAFRDAARRADVVFSTGGLGPTADDLTRQALAAAMDVELELDDGALAHIRGLFARRGREMPPSNRVQAMFPAGSRIIPNPHGTAPGIAARLQRADGKACHVFALPGVPAEMRQMWQETVARQLASLVGRRGVIHHYRLKCFGAGESQIEQMLPDLIRRGRSPSVGITASEATITLRVTASGENIDDCRRLMEPTVQTIRDCLGTLVYGEEEDELEHVVMRLLAAQNKTLATIESGTDGLLAGRLRNARTERYRGGYVVDGGDAASRVLGIPPADAHPQDPYGAEMVASWASGCLRQTGAELALAIGPFHATGDSSEHTDEAHLALATSEAVDVRPISVAGHPAILKPRVVKQALNWLRLALAGQL